MDLSLRGGAWWGMLASVGFFHFGKGHEEPVHSLWTAMEEADGKQSLRDSLIVLPEGFNIGKTYSDTNRHCNYDPGVVKCLQHMASEFGVAFVAGLIISTDCPEGSKVPYSGAYLIDSSRCQLLCRKTGKDQREGENYSGSPESLDEIGEYRGFNIAGLICMDASQRDNQARHDRLRRKIEARNGKNFILCVPAHTNQFVPEQMAQLWPGQHFAFANSDPNGCYSYARAVGGACAGQEPGACKPDLEKSKNKVDLVRLALGE